MNFKGRLILEIETLIILLFVVASMVAVIARKFRTPYTVALVLVGLGLSASHLLHAPQLTQDVLFMVFLPGLVFEAAYHIDFDELWRDRLAVLGLAVPGVAVSIGITAALIVFASSEIQHLPVISWMLALVFSAAVVATDPISVVSLFRELGAPRRLTLLIEGESLFNDGTAIVFFTLVLALVMGQTMTPAGIVVDFGLVVGGGLIIGAIIGLFVSQVIRRIDNAMVEITLTTVAAYGSFLVAYKLGYSGVMSTVAAGLICGNYGAQSGMSPSTRVATETFWEYIGFALNSLIFLLMGLEIQLNTLWTIWPMIVVAYVSITLARGVVVFGATSLLTLSRARIPRAWSIVLSWGGLRGALSMVLVLSLPREMPLREMIVNMVFGVVLLSILVQGLSMTPLARALGIIGKHKSLAAYEVARSRLRLANDVLALIGQMRLSGHINTHALDNLESTYRARTSELKILLEKTDIDASTRCSEDLIQLQRRMLLFEKKQALEARQRGTIGEDAFDALLADIDARFLELESAIQPCADREGKASSD